MSARVERITIYKSDHPWFAERQAALDGLRRRDLVGLGSDGSLSVFPDALTEPLSPEEREVVHKLLGYTWDRDHPLIAKRAGTVGGRAAIVGTRTPVWRIVLRSRRGASPEELGEELNLPVEHIRQALDYAAAPEHRDEIGQDLLDQDMLNAHECQVAST